MNELFNKLYFNVKFLHPDIIQENENSINMEEFFSKSLILHFILITSSLIILLCEIIY